jgi:ATP-dependent DNA ligase
MTTQIGRLRLPHGLRGRRQDLRKVVAESTPGAPTGLAEPVRSPYGSSLRKLNEGQALLRVAEKHGLEGGVSKRHDGPAEANRDRWRLFEARGR